MAAEASKKYATNPDYRGLPYHVDITNLESLNTMIDFTVKEGGRLDYAVNSAGVRIRTSDLSCGWRQENSKYSLSGTTIRSNRFRINLWEKLTLLILSA